MKITFLLKIANARFPVPSQSENNLAAKINYFLESPFRSLIPPPLFLNSLNWKSKVQSSLSDLARRPFQQDQTRDLMILSEAFPFAEIDPLRNVEGGQRQRYHKILDDCDDCLDTFTMP